MLVCPVLLPNAQSRKLRRQRLTEIKSRLNLLCGKKVTNVFFLTQVLTYHVLSGDVRAGNLSDGLQTATVNGKNITIQLEGGKAYINNVEIKVI